MKRGILLLFFVLGVLFEICACDISLSISSKKKEGFKVGDEVVVEVTVVLIHHNCALEIKQTKFTYEGVEILGATDWKETQPGTFHRQVKVKITNGNNKEPKLTVTRQCNKQGGYNAIVFKRS
jgi:hypothetical protein